MPDEQPFYTPIQMREMLGNGPDKPISKSTYYKLLRTKLLRSSRIYPGGPRIHTQQQVDDYCDYLNGRGEAGKRIAAVAKAS